MSTLNPSEALKFFNEKPLQSYAVTRKEWLPIIEQSEIFLAESEEEAREIAHGLKEELIVLIGDEVGVGGCQDRYEALMIEGMAIVDIAPVTIQRAEPIQ